MKKSMILLLAILTHSAFASDSAGDRYCNLAIQVTMLDGNTVNGCISSTSNDPGNLLPNPRVTITEANVGQRIKDANGEYYIRTGDTGDKICETVFPKTPYSGSKATKVLRFGASSIVFDGVSYVQWKDVGMSTIVYEDYLSCFDSQE